MRHTMILMVCNVIKMYMDSQAQGEAESVEIKAKAQAQAVEIIAKSLEGNMNSEAARLLLAKEVRND